jgi:hypothetical protein
MSETRHRVPVLDGYTAFFSPVDIIIIIIIVVHLPRHLMPCMAT